MELKIISPVHRPLYLHDTEDEWDVFALFCNREDYLKMQKVFNYFDSGKESELDDELKNLSDIELIRHYTAIYAKNLPDVLEGIAKEIRKNPGLIQVDFTKLHRELIGYQIVSNDYKGNTPDCFNSFEVFTDKAIAEKWLELEKLNPEHGVFRWKLVPVYYGEIEEPAFIKS